jgi:hypothetical protein
MVMHLFTDHPASVDETYGEHLIMASGFGWRLVLAGLACFAHALLPFLFVRTGSRMIAELHDSMVAQRRRQPAGRIAPRSHASALR